MLPLFVHQSIRWFRVRCLLPYLRLKWAKSNQTSVPRSHIVSGCCCCSWCFCFCCFRNFQLLTHDLVSLRHIHDMMSCSIFTEAYFCGLCKGHPGGDKGFHRIPCVSPQLWEGLHREWRRFTQPFHVSRLGVESWVSGAKDCVLGFAFRSVWTFLEQTSIKS